MNNMYHEDTEEFGEGYTMLSLIDTFHEVEVGGNCRNTWIAEYDGYHFEAKSCKALANKILRYVFSGGLK